MEEFYHLKTKLEGMTASELFEYAKKKYPEEENLGFGSKKIVVRRILNLERNRMNEQENAEA
jgi:hypothetical protein